MRLLRDWRLWAGALCLALIGIFAWIQHQRYQFDFVEQGRAGLVAQGYKREDLHVVSVTITRTLWGSDQATIVFQVGTEKNAKQATIGVRWSPFWSRIASYG